MNINLQYLFKTNPTREDLANSLQHTGQSLASFDIDRRIASDQDDPALARSFTATAAVPTAKIGFGEERMDRGQREGKRDSADKGESSADESPPSHSSTLRSPRIQGLPR